jgi:tryptophan halogenase
VIQHFGVIAQRIRLFKETGRVFKVPNELFGENSWTQVMLGQGIMPEQYHPIVELMSEQELSHFLSQIKQQNQRLVAQLPSHHTFLQSYCPAKPK